MPSGGPKAAGEAKTLAAGKNLSTASKSKSVVFVPGPGGGTLEDSNPSQKRDREEDEEEDLLSGIPHASTVVMSSVEPASKKKSKMATNKVLAAVGSGAMHRFPVNQWLQSLDDEEDTDQLSKTFVDHGYDDMKCLCERGLSGEELTTLGVEKETLRKAIMESLDNYKFQFYRPMMLMRYGRTVD